LALDFLPKELDTQDLLKKISIEARKAGVQLGKFTPKEPVSKDFYDEMPIEIGVKGEYGQLLSFLVSVSKLPRIVTVRNVDLGTPTIADRAAILTMTGVLVAYRYKETK
jgi:type IV pilus assembly protein PilO